MWHLSSGVTLLPGRHQSKWTKLLLQTPESFFFLFLLKMVYALMEWNEQDKGTASARTLRQEPVGSFGETSRRSL
jgi:hypothetical protein